MGQLPPRFDHPLRRMPSLAKPPFCIYDMRMDLKLEQNRWLIRQLGR